LHNNPVSCNDNIFDMNTKRTIVIKIGGSTLESNDTTLSDIVSLQDSGNEIVVVHGGGPLISDWMKRQGLLPRFIKGLRVTDSASLEIAVAVLAGLINKQLVSTIASLGGRAIGLSGVDGNMLQGQISNPDLGFVGRITKVDPNPILGILQAGYIPMIAPVAIAETEQAGSFLLNINGDIAAGHLAWALKADELIFLTDVAGVLDSSGRLISRLTAREARGLITAGIAHGGMIPKLESCIVAIERVPKARILDGRHPGTLIKALNNDTLGTQIIGKY
jgi:acetylglutamate kinase